MAIIGAGPAGLTAGLDLVRLGHKVKIFDALPVAGGMIRVGIPPHRLPYERMDWEIQQVLDEGVELQLNTRIDDVPGLLRKSDSTGRPDGGPYDAVLIATGAHVAKKVDIPGNEHPDNWLSLDFLKKVCLGNPPDLSGRKVAVIGGGNVALDCARSAVQAGGGRSAHDLPQAEGRDDRLRVGGGDRRRRGRADVRFDPLQGNRHRPTTRSSASNASAPNTTAMTRRAAS